MAGITHKLGGLWFFLIGSPLAAWFIYTFFVAPYLFPGGYTINLATVLSFSQPLPILVFLGLWFGLALGYFGAGAYRHSRHS